MLNLTDTFIPSYTRTRILTEIGIGERLPCDYVSEEKAENLGEKKKDENM